MTDRLYYTDPDLLEFEAKIVSSEKQGDGTYLTILDRSAFYPTSGGQSHDLGQLGPAEMVEVIETDSGEVAHLTSSSPGEAGETISGRVDPDRRMKNRQLHTAQHLLSQVFYRLLGGTTMSVHLGEEYGAIEFDQERISAESLLAAEREVNRMVSACVPIEIIFADSSEIEKLGLRKQPARDGKLRIIKMGDLEATACGGTHCTNTGQVQLVKLIGTEPIRKRTMVKFLAGVQATEDYHQRFDISNQLTRTLTCGLIDLPDKLDKLTAEIRSLKRNLTAAQKQLLPLFVEELIKQVNDLSGISSVIAVISEDKLELGQQLAIDCAERIAGLALLISGDRLFLACTRGSGPQAGKLMRELASRTNIKGGGNDVIAQGAKADPEQINDYREIIIEVLK